MNALEKYIFDNSSPEEELMRELERVTYQRAVHPHMISGHLQGSLLRMITAMTSPRNVLEIGTFTGYSTLSIAAALPEGATIDTIDVNDELQDISLSFFERSPHGGRIRQYIGSALDIAPTLGKQYDLVFIDGGKREYPDYLRMLLGDEYTDGTGQKVKPTKPLIASGGFMIADNILWYGKVADPACRDADTMAIVEFNKIVVSDSRLENIIIPLRDGLNLIRYI
jgi:caffeoyl-CoA O-methyltransferase